MSDRELKARLTGGDRLRTAAREVERSQALKTPVIRREGTDQVTCRLGDAFCAGAHAARLMRAPSASAAGASHALLQLQRHYGNRFVRRVLAGALQRDGGGEV